MDHGQTPRKVAVQVTAQKRRQDDDETKLSDDEVTELQRWRRGCNAMWASELLRADGRTLLTRFAAGLRQRIWNCKADAQRI